MIHIVKRLLRLMTLLLILIIIGTLAFSFGEKKVYTSLYPLRYEEYVNYYAGKYGMDPALLYAFIKTESGFDPEAISSVGARGLTQMTEETFDWVKGRIAKDESLRFEDLSDPETSIRFGSYYIYRCLERYHWDIATTAAAYHSGWTTVDKLLAQQEYSSDGETLTVFPYENMNYYVYKIQAAHGHYLELYEERNQTHE